MKKYAICAFVILFSINVFSQQNIKSEEKAPPVNITDWVLNTPEDKDLKNKFIVLEFWATWCAPCLQAVPHLNDLQDKFKRDDLYFISITDEPVHKIEKAHSVVDFKTIVVSDQTKTTQKQFGDGKRGITQLPLTVLIDNKGIIKWIGSPSKLTETVLDDFLNTKLKINTPQLIDISDFKNELNKNGSALEKILYLAADKETKFYIEIEKSKSTRFRGNEKAGTKLFYLEFANTSDILKSIFHYNINEIFVHEDLDKDRYDIWFKNDSLSKEKALDFLRDTLFSKLNIDQKESFKKITAKELVMENKNLLEKSTDKESHITNIQGKKTMYSRITLKNLAEELNKIFPHYFVFLSKDEESYNFFIDDNSYEKTIRDLKQYGITVRDKETEIKQLEFYRKN